MNANKQDAGGLPELPEPVLTAYTKKDGVTPFWKYDGMPMAHEGRREDRGTNKAIHLYTADQMRAYGELCRAAPAGGDAEVVRLRQLLAGTQEQFRVVSELLERNQAHHERMMKLMDSAPAGGDGDKFRPGAPCHSPGSCLKNGCRENGCSAVDRELLAPSGSGEVLSVYSLNRVIDRVEGEAQWNDWSQGRILTELRNYIRAQATVIPDPQSMGDDEADNIESYATALERMSMCNSRTADGANLSQAARLIHDYAALLRKLQQGADYTRVGWLSVGPSRDVSFGVNNRSVEDRPGTYDLYIASQGQEGGANG